MLHNRFRIRYKYNTHLAVVVEAAVKRRLLLERRSILMRKSLSTSLMRFKKLLQSILRLCMKRSRMRSLLSIKLYKSKMKNMTRKRKKKRNSNRRRFLSKRKSKRRKFMKRLKKKKKSQLKWLALNNTRKRLKSSNLLLQLPPENKWMW
jgi:hypothetical protein